MKIDWNKKYNTIAIYACIVIVFAIVILMIGMNFSSVLDWVGSILLILSPIAYGFVFAYLLNPLMKLCENKWLKFIGAKERKLKFRRKKSPSPAKVKRLLSVIITYLIFIIVISMFVWLVAPQIASSYNDLESKMSFYISSAASWIENLGSESELFKTIVDFIDADQIIQSATDFLFDSYALIQKLTPYVANFANSLLSGVKNVVLGIFVSIYLLLSKEKLIAQLKKFICACFKKKHVHELIEIARYTDKTFGGFIVGKLLDALLVGVVSFIVFGIVNIPYYPLIAVIIGVTNIIPFFGPFIGAIPSAFIIFIASPEKVLWFIIIILIIQQIDGNLIAPKIIGTTIGLDAIWVLVSIIVMSGLFGIPGMFIGEPIFALFYAGVKRLIERKLAKNSLPTETDKYFAAPPESVNVSPEDTTDEVQNEE